MEDVGQSWKTFVLWDVACQLGISSSKKIGAACGTDFHQVCRVLAKLLFRRSIKDNPSYPLFYAETLLDKRMMMIDESPGQIAPLELLNAESRLLGAARRDGEACRHGFRCPDLGGLASIPDPF
jgi:hypothetical protein